MVTFVLGCCQEIPPSPSTVSLLYSEPGPQRVEIITRPVSLDSGSPFALLSAMVNWTPDCPIDQPFGPVAVTSTGVRSPMRTEPTALAGPETGLRYATL